MSVCKLFAAFVLLVLSLQVSAEQEKPENALSAAQVAQSESVSDDLQDLTGRLNRIQTISGAFVQYAVDKRGTTIQESRGSFKAKRPDYFYWHTEAPLEQYVFADGDYVTVYDPDLEQATVQQHSSQIEQSPAVLFSGKTSLIAGMYDVTKQTIDQQVSEFILRPKDRESLFDTMRIRFSGNSIQEMRLRDSLGQESTIRFVHSEINSDIPDSAFSPDFPPGTDVIEDLTRATSPD